MRPYNVRLLDSLRISERERHANIMMQRQPPNPLQRNNQILFNNNKLHFNGNNQTLCSKITKSSPTINETFHNNQSQLVREGADFGQGRGNGSDQSIRRQVQRP